MTRTAYVAAAVVAAACIVGAPIAAFATWSTSGTGSAAGAAAVMPAGNTPSASGAGSSVTLRWSGATLANGTPVQGYLIKRYDSNGVLQTTGANCSGIITTTTCTETNVPSGQWRYADVPVLNSWTGAQSTLTTVTV